MWCKIPYVLVACVKEIHLSSVDKKKFVRYANGSIICPCTRIKILRATKQQAEDKNTVKESSSGELSSTNNQSKAVKVKIWRVSNTEDCLSIILVKVMDSNGNLIPTYAFLDNGSTTTFFTRHLLGSLTQQNVKPTQLYITTMHAENVRMDTELVTGIEICGVN